LKKLKKYIAILLALSLLLLSIPAVNLIAEGDEEQKPDPPTILKTVNPTQSMPGGTVRYTITVHNPNEPSGERAESYYWLFDYLVVDRFPAALSSPVISSLRVYQDGVRLHESQTNVSGIVFYADRFDDDDEIAILIHLLPPGSETVITFDAVVAPSAAPGTLIRNDVTLYFYPWMPSDVVFSPASADAFSPASSAEFCPINGWPGERVPIEVDNCYAIVLVLGEQTTTQPPTTQPPTTQHTTQPPTTWWPPQPTTQPPTWPQQTTRPPTPTTQPPTQQPPLTQPQTQQPPQEPNPTTTTGTQPPHETNPTTGTGTQPGGEPGGTGTGGGGAGPGGTGTPGGGPGGTPGGTPGGDTANPQTGDDFTYTGMVLSAAGFALSLIILFVLLANLRKKILDDRDSDFLV